MKKSLLMLSAAALVTLSACTDYVGKEKSHPLFIKASREKAAGEYREAARCYEEFLLICPKSSVTHQELGNLYSDYLNDPLKAVYHYRKWMEMNPNDKTNFEDVRLLADTAQKNLFKNLKEEYKEFDTNPQSEAEVKQLREQLIRTQETLKQTEDQNQKMKERLLAIKSEREKLNAQTIAQNRRNQAAAAAANPPAPAPSANAGGKTPAAAPAPAGNEAAQTYTVQPGDNLSKISRKFYGTTRYYQLIADANKAKLGPRLQLRPGQVLTIPPKPKR
ncbi:MAG: LysM peptidoglycan-binding domain-containing protein [Lentisphaeria bacterium]|nr:LysM peptidoglycan-binding domain-containing protein [Lentisphaeria bacterium]